LRLNFAGPHLQAKQKAEAAKLKELQAKAAKGGPLLGGGSYDGSPVSVRLLSLTPWR
jgi:hypothetical protein